jgi:proteasome assembly chaperone (PAC2) family protein
MEHLQIDQIPNLRSPIVIAAFAGWNDAAEAASSSLKLLREAWSARRFASIDPEEFYDFSETRPRIRLIDGVERTLEWPANEFYYHSDAELQRDFVLLLGVEPNLRWRTFTREVVDLLRQVKATLVLTLGALLADTPHTRPVRVTGFATDPDLAGRVSRTDVNRSRYEGPTGIVGVLHDALRREGFATASLWANVPHYISASPNPRANAALLDRVSAVFDLPLDLSLLEEQGQEFDAQVAAAVAENPELVEYVHTLEEREDEQEREGPSQHDLPSGESLFDEVEEFLRRRRDNGDGDEGEDQERGGGDTSRTPHRPH